MSRPNMKSVRLSDQALAIVNDAPGNGFNDKFEKLIFDYSNSIPNRLAQLEAIDKRILQKKQDLESLQRLESNVRAMVSDLGQIADLIPRVVKSVNDVTQ